MFSWLFYLNSLIFKGEKLIVQKLEHKLFRWIYPEEFMICSSSCHWNRSTWPTAGERLFITFQGLFFLSFYFSWTNIFQVTIFKRGHSHIFFTHKTQEVSDMLLIWFPFDLRQTFAISVLFETLFITTGQENHITRKVGEDRISALFFFIFAHLHVFFFTSTVIVSI